MTSVRRVSRKCSGRRPAQSASLIIACMRGSAAMRAAKCAGAAMSRRHFDPDSGLASIECRLCQTVAVREDLSPMVQCQLAFQADVPSRT